MPHNEQQAKALDRSDAVPLYHQLFLQLRDEILSGQRPYGAAVPTEKQLSESCGVSRITARRALAELARNHFVSRKRRVGTRVTFRPPVKPLEANMDQVVDSLIDFAKSTRVRVLALRTVVPDAWVTDALQLEAGTRAVHAVRLRYLDREPLGYIISYVPLELAPQITRERLAEQPILKLITESGCRLGKATQVVAAILADPLLCRFLRVEPRSPILRITRTVFDRRNRPLLLTIAHYRSDRYQLRLDLQH